MGDEKVEEQATQVGCEDNPATQLLDFGSEPSESWGKSGSRGDAHALLPGEIAGGATNAAVKETFDIGGRGPVRSHVGIGGEFDTTGELLPK